MRIRYICQYCENFSSHDRDVVIDHETQHKADCKHQDCLYSGDFDSTKNDTEIKMNKTCKLCSKTFTSAFRIDDPENCKKVYEALQ